VALTNLENVFFSCCFHVSNLALVRCFGLSGRIYSVSCRTTTSHQHPSTLVGKIDGSTASAALISFSLFQPFSVPSRSFQLLHGPLVLLLHGSSILLLDLGGGLIGGFLIALHGTFCQADEVATVVQFSGQTFSPVPSPCRN